eukprot:1462413-Alexandrium_andersonii.AAC.1
MGPRVRPAPPLSARPAPAMAAGGSPIPGRAGAGPGPETSGPCNFSGPELGEVHAGLPAMGQQELAGP